MARGITEYEVHTAADSLVAAGERPTVERIRAHLGTGSPNTVTRWLETWWQGLGKRLDAHRARMAVPNAPDAVVRAAGQWWSLALEAARASLAEELSVEHAALHADRDALLKARVALDAEAVVLRNDTDTALAAKQLAEAQSVELARLVSRLETHIEELAFQRDSANAREAETEASRQSLEQRLQTLQTCADAEREGFLQHIRAVEDRANTEVDRARQEAKNLQIQLNEMRRVHAVAEKAARQLLDQAGAEAKDTQRELSLLRTRAEAAESRLGQLQDVSAAVEAAIRRVRASPRENLGQKAAPNKPRKRSKLASSK